MKLKESLKSLLEKFNKQNFRDIDVDGTLYRISTEIVELGTQIEIVAFDEEGNEVLTLVDDNVFTIEDVNFRTENGIVVEIIEAEDVTDSVTEVLFSEEDMTQLLEIIETAVEQINNLETKVLEMENEIVEMRKFKAEFSKAPQSNGLPKLFKTKDANIDYRELARKYKK